MVSLSFSQTNTDAIGKHLQISDPVHSDLREIKWSVVARRLLLERPWMARKKQMQVYKYTCEYLTLFVLNFEHHNEHIWKFLTKCRGCLYEPPLSLCKIKLGHLVTWWYDMLIWPGQFDASDKADAIGIHLWISRSLCIVQGLTDLILWMYLTSFLHIFPRGLRVRTKCILLYSFRSIVIVIEKT